LLYSLIYDNLMLMKTDQQEENRNTVYEIGCLFVPIISDKDVLTEVSKIKSSLEKLDCDFLSGDGPDTKELAYPMKKMIDGEKHLFVKAYFVWLKFTANSDKLIGLKEGLDKNKNILRYILIKTIKEDVLVSDQKRILSKIIDEKNKKPIKPVKIIKKEEVTPIDILGGVSKDKGVSKLEEKDLDDTIDKLVIK